MSHSKTSSYFTLLLIVVVVILGIMNWSNNYRPHVDLVRTEVARSPVPEGGVEYIDPLPSPAFTISQPTLDLPVHLPTNWEQLSDHPPKGSGLKIIERF